MYDDDDDDDDDEDDDDNHHHISFMELDHLLTRSGLTYPELTSKVYYESFCQLGSSVSLPWVMMITIKIFKMKF